MGIDVDDIVLRKAEPGDISFLEELFHEELQYHMSLLPGLFKMPKTLVKKEWLESILHDDSVDIVVAEYKGDIVGIILYKIITQIETIILKDRRYGYVEEMIVREPFRRMGIGGRLLDHALQELVSKNITEIEINVWEDNRIGIRFYEKHGFQTIRRRMKIMA